MERTHFTRTAQLLHKFQKRTQQQPQAQPQPHPSAAHPQGRQPKQPANRSQAAPPLPPPRTAAAPLSTPNAAASSSSSSSSPSPPLPSVSLHSTPFTPPRAVVPGVVPGQPYVTAADLARFQRTELQQPTLHRSALDKLVDFVLGDGPNNRFALICSNCLRQEHTTPAHPCLIA